MNGILALFKPKGLTSAELLNQFKTFLVKEIRSTNPRKRKRVKVGHGGTLDKDAEGVLVVGLGDGCKQLKTYLEGRKRYLAIGKLGSATDTFDASGKVTNEAKFGHISIQDFESVLKTFTGKIQQAPPVYSAVKVQGKRASDLARQGKPPDLQPREVTVYDLTCIDFNPPLFKLDVYCGSGTYVRSIVNDIGQELKSAAHLVDLSRTEQGPYKIDQALRQGEWSLERVGEVLKGRKSTKE
ncbi:pseudouridylate synthase TRUB1-like [Oscarella lobularis]|uniref:pseudouridylate synthase TRUB1-like n=1 Tax=Oscarella lobularis TaxID=121494 RepID=UPI0033143562